MASFCIHHLVNSREGKSILQVSIIEVRIIDTHAPLAILLRDDHDIGQPLGVLNLSNEFNGKELNSKIFIISSYYLYLIITFIT